MAKAFKCDRCGKLLENAGGTVMTDVNLPKNHPKHKQISVRVSLEIHRPGYTNPHSYGEYCIPCKKFFAQKILDSLKKEVEKK